MLDCDLVGSLDRLKRDPEGRLAMVDHKTAARSSLSISNYATAMNGLADQEDLRLRFDVLTKTQVPELHRP